MNSVEDIKSGEDYDRFGDEAEVESPCDECGAHGNVTWCWRYGGNLCLPCEDGFFEDWDWWEDEDE